MDPIKNMISAADPMPNDSSAQDGEAALRRMLTEPQMFSDSLPREVSSSFVDRQRRRSARLGGILTLAAVAATAGLLVATNLGSVTTAPRSRRLQPLRGGANRGPNADINSGTGCNAVCGRFSPGPDPTRYCPCRVADVCQRRREDLFRVPRSVDCTMARPAASAACARDRSPTRSWIQ
jgi:hypothetical protein